MGAPARATASQNRLLSQVRLDKRRIGLLTASHFANDLYGNCLTSMLPFLIPSLGLSLPLAGLLVATHQMTSSVVQPLLGHIADRSGTRIFSFVGTAAVAIGMSLLGIAPVQSLLFVLVAVAGLGTASFHPQSAAMVNALSSGRRGMIMSTYITAGNAGFALGPIMVVAVVERFGLHGTPILAVPGLLSAILLARYAPTNWLRRPASGAARPSLKRVVIGQWSLLTRLLGVATLRAITTISLVTFLPLLLKSRGYPDQVWAALLTLFLLSGTIGGLLGGYLSDIVGRRWVIVGSLLVSVPFVLGMLRVEGIALWALTILAGSAILGAFSVLTIQAQEMLPENVGMASGLMLGFSMGIGGLAMGPLSVLAEGIGIPQTLDLLALLPLVAGLLAVTLVDRTKISGALTHPASDQAGK